MSKNGTQSKADKLDVQLNEAFERLEKKADDRGSAIDTPKTPAVGTFLGIFLALIATGIASYTAWTVYMMPDVTDEIVSVRNRLAAASERSSAQGVRLDALADEVGRLRESRAKEIDAIEKRVNQLIGEVRQSTGTSAEDWLMAEVEYLLRLGNHRVLLERDPKGAIALFEAADEIVRDARGVTAFALREAIASDVAKLKAVRDIDVDGIFVKMAALKGLVGDLKQRDLAYTPAHERSGIGGDPRGAAEGLAEKTLEMLERAGARLAGMVEFRSEGERIKPVLPPEEEYYLRQNLILKIQLAQLALLRGDSDIFTDSLNEAKVWIAEYFLSGDPVTNVMLNDLDEVMNVDIAREMPDVSGSLREVRKLLSSFHEAEDSGIRQ